MMPNCVATPGPDLPDPMGIDSDCDGVDGNAATSIFVALGGDDTKGGTRVAPVGSLERAYEIADAEGWTTILLGEGEYDIPLELREGLDVHGGYAPLGDGWWARDGRTVIRTRQPGLVAEGIEAPTLVTRLEIFSEDAAPGESAVAVRMVDVTGLILQDVVVQVGAAGDGENGSEPVSRPASADGQAGFDASYDGSTYCDPFGPLGPFVARGGDGAGAAGRRGGDGGDGGSLVFAFIDRMAGEDGEPGDGDVASEGPLGGFRTPSLSAPIGGDGWNGAPGLDGLPGAAGGAGGVGGDGGLALLPPDELVMIYYDAGGIPYFDFTAVMDPSHGGAGGDGGLGGQGGGGAGGSGGSSFAVVRDPSSVPVFDSFYADLSAASAGTEGLGFGGSADGLPGRVGEVAIVAADSSVVIESASP